MDVINGANRIFASIMKVNPALSGDYDVRRNRYVLAEDCDDGLLLWNYLTNCMVFLAGKTTSDWENDNFDPQDKISLTLQYFYVKADFDEPGIMDQINDIATSMQGKDVSYYYIFPTSACNARCPYCFESDVGFRACHMSEDTANKAADMILSRYNGGKIGICWFGGEPLVNTKAIDIIAKRLTDNDVNWFAWMVSNGYLFDPDIVTKAKNDWRVGRIQITLDGTRDVYNRIKNYKGNPDDPFSTVKQNISLLADAGIKVSIRLNLLEDNYADLEQLIHQLHDEYAGNENIKVYVGYIFGNHNLAPDVRAQVWQNYLDLVALLEQYGWYNVKPLRLYPFRSRCLAENSNTLTITPTGRIGKCDHTCEENEDALIGDLDSIGDFDPDEWMSKRRSSDCYQCPIKVFCFKKNHCLEGMGLTFCSETLRDIATYAYRTSMVVTYRKWKDAQQ